MVIERFKNHEAIPGLPALPGKRPDDTERSSLRGKLVGTNFDRCFQLKEGEDAPFRYAVPRRRRNF